MSQIRGFCSKEQARELYAKIGDFGVRAKVQKRDAIVTTNNWDAETVTPGDQPTLETGRLTLTRQVKMVRA